MISLRRMNNSEIERIREIDRSEHVTLAYFYKSGKIKAKKVDWHVHRWFTDGHSDHSVQARINTWKVHLDKGGIMFGAFDENILVGIAILRPSLTTNMAQFAVLHVSRVYRGKGIGTKLIKRIFRLAINLGAKKLYVSAAQTANTVDFYMKHGFKLAKKVNRKLFALEPEDIHMIKDLEKEMSQ